MKVTETEVKNTLQEKLINLLHNVKLNFGFFQAANDVIKLIVSKLMANI